MTQIALITLLVENKSVLILVQQTVHLMVQLMLIVKQAIMKAFVLVMKRMMMTAKLVSKTGFTI